MRNRKMKHNPFSQLNPHVQNAKANETGKMDYAILVVKANQFNATYAENAAIASQKQAKTIIQTTSNLLNMTRKFIR